MTGKVWLVGAGPGDPDLLTVRAHRVLEHAEVVAYDELVPGAILELAARAERIPVGRRAGHACAGHDGVHPAVLERARAGTDVVRLKSGDPMIFGRGGEEARALADAGIAVEIVPGITAALGAAATSALPLTYRGVASAVTFATAHARADDPAWPRALAAGLPRAGTLVLYMGTSSIDRIAAALVETGRAPTTPVRVISHATWPSERRLDGTLATIGELARAEPPALPAVIVIGDVVDLARRETSVT